MRSPSKERNKAVDVAPLTGPAGHNEYPSTHVLGGTQLEMVVGWMLWVELLQEQPLGSIDNISEAWVEHVLVYQPRLRR